MTLIFVPIVTNTVSGLKFNHFPFVTQKEAVIARVWALDAQIFDTSTLQCLPPKMPLRQDEESMHYVCAA